MKAVIFARVSTQEQEAEGCSINTQFAKLREYCKANDIEIIKEIIGKVNLADIDFSEQTVVLGVKLDFGIDFKYVDCDSLEYLHPKSEQESNILFCGLDWHYQLFSKGYPQQHKYRFFDIIEHTLAEESLVLKNRFAQITSSNEDLAFDEGINLAKKANPDWSIELLYGFNLLEKLVQKKLNISEEEAQFKRNKGINLYKMLYEDSSFKTYLKKFGNDDYSFAIQSMAQMTGDNYRNILAHELFIECLDMESSNKSGEQHKYGVMRVLISDRYLGSVEKLREFYQFIQKWV